MLCNSFEYFFLAQVQHGGGGPALDRDKSPSKRLFCMWLDWLIALPDNRTKNQDSRQLE